MSIRIVYFILILSSALTREGYAGTRWQGSVPSVMKESAPWVPLVDHLLERNLNVGAIATSYRMLIFFSDLNSKEAAFKSIIKSIERGYPFDAKNAFITGDIVPNHDDYNFYNTYNLYKAVIHQKAGSLRWAENYFSNIDKENFPKYLFFKAIESYQRGELKKSEELLKKILAKETGEPDRIDFARKVSRSLARVYFDQEEYLKSLEIYQSLLLKMNPIIQSDWLEAAWNLYHLKRYSEALGTLYNLESKENEKSIDLEKYTIRALIYRKLCAGDQAAALTQNFESNFGSIIFGIKRGEALTRYPVLSSIMIPENEEYREIVRVIEELRSEFKRLSDLAPQERSLAVYIYNSEIGNQQQRLKLYQDQALENSARAMVMVSEQLRFLGFDVAREKFNPDAVFKPSPGVTLAGTSTGAQTQAQSETLSLTEEGKKKAQNDPSSGETSYAHHWEQFGDYWRDERNTYKSPLVSQCAQ